MVIRYVTKPVRASTILRALLNSLWRLFNLNVRGFFFKESYAYVK